MAHLRAIFEKDLKQKLIIKSNDHLSEEAVLLKSFKYFDLTNTGTVNKQQFIQALEKIGLQIDNQDDLAQLFDYYDSSKTEKLDYKNFISLMYNNSTATTRKLSPTKNYSKTVTAYFRGYSAQDSVIKLQKKLQEKGVLCLLRLCLKFREFDKQNVRKISLQEFINSLSELNIQLVEDEVKDCFYYFDKEKSGTTNYDELVQGLRGPVQSFRKNLIKQAFTKLDSNNLGYLFVDQLKGNFCSQNHPDVRVGKRTQGEVMNEFIKLIDYFIQFRQINGGQMIYQDFMDLYGFISASIENDTFFEILINSVWKGEIQDLKHSQQNSQMQTPLQQQSPLKSEAGQQQQNENFSSPNKPVEAEEVKQEMMMPNQQQLSEQKSETKSQVSHIDQTKTPSNLLKQQFIQNINPVEVFKIVKEKLKVRGIRGFVGIYRQLKIMDDDYDQKLNIKEFQKALRDYKINLSEAELRVIFECANRDNQGLVSLDYLLYLIHGEMSEHRKNLVIQAFSKLDKDRDDIITIQDIKTIYNAKNHPDVRKGQKSEDEILGEFLETFELHHNLKCGMRDQRVTKQEFIDYYQNVSATIDDEQYFLTALVNAYKLYNEIPEYQSFAPVQLKQQLMQQQDFRSKVTQNAPFGTSNAQMDYSTWLRPNTAKSNQQQEYQQVPLKKVPAGLPSWPGFSQYQQNMQQNPETPMDILNQLKIKIKQRGIRGILNLYKSFAQQDDKKNKMLNFIQVQKVLNDMRIGLNELQVKSFFEWFDRDQQGYVDYDELLITLRGDMSDMRKNLLIQAFSKLDKNQSGKVDFKAIKDMFVASNHPDIKFQKKTEEEVIGEFIDTFDQHHSLIAEDDQVKQAIVTFEEFIEYYSYVSMMIDDDKYFESVIRTSWNVPMQRPKEKFCL